jgi:hypothetical protein
MGSPIQNPEESRFTMQIVSYIYILSSIQNTFQKKVFLDTSTRIGGYDIVLRKD